MRRIRESGWVADLCLLAMPAFFIVLGGVDLGESSGLAIVLGALAPLAIAHSWSFHLRYAGLERSRSPRSDSVPRGF